MLLNPFDLEITKLTALKKLLADRAAGARAKADLDFLLTVENQHTEKLIKLLHKSKSQFRQDLFVLSQLDFKPNGYFVEFGATNGIDLSNTHLLEKEFSWIGILAEPANCWHSTLHQNRTAHIDTDCVWSTSNSTLIFNESEIPDLSTISAFCDADHHSKLRVSGKSYEVKTISLNDLLEKYNAPAQIDYLSIDTEGSEFEILSHFDFSKYTFRVITCEHNFTPMREKIFDLLTANEYNRVHQDISGVDDWYIRQIG